MFIGHYAVAFAAKRQAPAVSLGALFFAAQLADLLWPPLVLAGVERVVVAPGITAVTPLDFESYPWSHSLLMLVVWGLLVGVGHRLLRGSTQAAVLLGGCVVSHWVLDWLSHRPDMPLFPGGPRFGLGLWMSRPATLIVELGLFAAAVGLYVRRTRPADRIGRWGLASLVAFLVVVYLGNLFGPPPPSTAAIAWTGNAMWLLVLWGAWIDRHRTGPPATADTARR